MFDPSYSRQCACQEAVLDDDGSPILLANGRPKKRKIGATCPKLEQKGHGTWYFYFELEAGEGGTRQRVRRGGFAKKDDAKKKAEEIYLQATGGADVMSKTTVGEDLHAWLKRKRNLARTTRHGYEEHIKLYLEPHLGHIKRRDLKLRHIEAMYDAIERENAERLLHHAKVVELELKRDAAHTAWVRAAGKQQERREARRAYLKANAALREGRMGKRKITSAATLHRINATLSSFLNNGIKRQEYATNLASLIELPPIKRPKPLVWTPERVEEWKRTGVKPGPVMVWTAEQTGAFLDFVRDDRLYAMWHTFTFIGPRRGEVAALPWTEVSTTALTLRISAQIVEVAYRLYGEAPKADSVRMNTLTEESGRVLTAWRIQQDQEREQWAEVEAWQESGCVFTQENGAPLHPDWISRRFQRLVELSGLPPVRLHDLRHISATLSLLAKNDIKTVQERLGHSSRQITSDTYTSVLPELMRAEAESTLAVVPRNVPYQEQQRLKVPEEAFRDDVAVLYVHGSRYTGGKWSVGAKLRHDGDVLGEIRAVSKGPDQTSDAAIKWISEHCASNSYEVLRVEDHSNQYSEEQRPYFALLRFFIARPAGRDVENFVRPQRPEQDASHQIEAPERGRSVPEDDPNESLRPAA
ncbi:site-specific integrase [Streptomyces flavofungini]|uniref:site-specific integrase n=1 Tax=Streptomyces flavofungini TaxID=68200 RepID=UPI0025B14FC7|nr:site-specific integrase [Streptomyces flavofungini]WJV48859.1 tyrosine-type recombinase/integrase [Streptomyces flavofungini]